MNHNKKHWKVAILSALAVLCVGVGAGSMETITQADAEIAEGSVVSVTIGETTTGYTDLVSAMEAVNAADSVKLTLLTNVDGGNTTYWLETALTLDLAGYTLSGASLPMELGNPSLMIEDSSEEGAGEVIPVSGLTFSTMFNGSVTINGGTFYGVGLNLTSNNTDGSIIINGGTFKDYVSLQAESGTVTINGGVFEGYAMLQDYGGELLVKGGEFKKIDVRSANNDVLFADFIVDGYALKNSAGEYVDIYNNYIFGDTYTVAEHTCDLTKTQYDEDAHWTGCDCYRKPEDSVEEAHTLETKHNDNGHWQECECGYATGADAHSYGDWTVTKEATETETGEQERTCACGHTETEEIAKLEKKKKGCGSVIGGTLALVSMAIAAVAVCKKKEN